MSKKAKRIKSSTKRKKTIIMGLKCEAHNYKSLADQYGADVMNLKAEVAKVTEQADNASKRSLAKVDEIMRLRDAINNLKEIIAGLERSNAEQSGTIHALHRQIDQAAPKVMVAPPRMLSPLEAQQYHQPTMRVDRSADLEAFHRASGVVSQPRKHWTAI